MRRISPHAKVCHMNVECEACQRRARITVQLGIMAYHLCPGCASELVLSIGIEVDAVLRRDRLVEVPDAGNPIEKV